jgi:hypothetical protein
MRVSPVHGGMNLIYILPVVLVALVIYLLVTSKRVRGTGAAPLRPDETEPHELKGPEQHKRRRGSGTSAPDV